MAKELRLIPEALSAGAQRFAALADASATVRAQARQHWSRLDAGWQSYARDNAEAYFGDAVRALERDESMLRQMGAALLRALRRIDAGDTAASQLFEAVGRDGVTGGGPGANLPGAPDFSLDPLAGLAPTLGAPFLDRPRSGAPVPVSGAPPPPGLKISGVERTVVPEVCGIDGHCNAVTAQISTAFRPTLQPVSFVFGTDGAARAVELSLGKLGSIPLGTLQLGPSGFEYTFAALAAQLVTYSLAGGVTVSVLAEPMYGSKPFNGQPASYAGEKFSIVVSDPATGVTSKGSVALRIYSYDKPNADPKPAPGGPARPAPQPSPQPSWPNPGNGGSQQPLPAPPVIVPGLLS